MKHRSVSRLAALALLVAFLAAVAAPAAAAPSADGLAAAWSPVSLLHWLQSVWTGFLGADATSSQESQDSGIGNLHAATRNVAEPDGVSVASTGSSDDDGTSPFQVADGGSI